MRHLITFACLAAAVTAYIIGWWQGVTGFVVVGMLLEGIFWFRLLRKKKQKISLESGR